MFMKYNYKDCVYIIRSFKKRFFLEIHNDCDIFFIEMSNNCEL